jgi:hypothetical protein
VIERDAAVDNGDRLPGADESVVVADLRQPGYAVGAGERLLDIAHQRFDVSLRGRVEPEIGVRIAMMHKRGRLVHEAAMMFELGHFTDEMLLKGIRRHHAALFQTLNRPISRLASP